MPKMLQVRNVSDGVHRTLRVRAAMAGQSLSEYVRGEITRWASQPSFEELCERLATRAPVNPRVPAAEIIRQERARR